jgi:hypothetical protein
MSQKNPLLAPILVSVVLGVAAGGVSAILVASSLPAPVTGGAEIVRPRDAATEAIPEAVVSPTSGAGRSLVLLYPPKAGKSLADRTYLPKDAIAAATILTADGWLVSHGSAASGDHPGWRGQHKLSELVAVIGGRTAVVEREVDDPFTGLTFLKVAANGIPAVAFGPAEAPSAGDVLFAFDATRGVRRMAVTAIDDAPATTAADLLQSSERLQKLIRLTPDADVVPGSMLLDKDGDLAGVVIRQGTLGASAVPLSAFIGQLSEVFRGTGIGRPYLGVRYLDLSRLAGALAENDQSRGALLSASLDGKLAAVIARSPAADARLRAGDVITAVNDEEVTPRRALADIIAEYAPATQVRLSYLRDGATQTADVVLGTAPQAK